MFDENIIYIYMIIKRMQIFETLILLLFFEILN